MDYDMVEVGPSNSNMSAGARQMWGVFNARFSILNQSTPISHSAAILSIQKQIENSQAITRLADAAHAATMVVMESIDLATATAHEARAEAQQRRQNIGAVHSCNSFQPCFKRSSSTRCLHAEGEQIKCSVATTRTMLAICCSLLLLLPIPHKILCLHKL